MNTLNLLCTLLLTVLLPLACFASSVKLFFTSDELNEMGVCLQQSDLEAE
jgi:hypothetical protein